QGTPARGQARRSPPRCRSKPTRHPAPARPPLSTARKSAPLSRPPVPRRNRGPRLPQKPEAAASGGSSLILLAKHPPQGGPGVLAAPPPAPLQLRHDVVHELLDGSGAIDGRQHEAVSPDGINEGLHLVGDAASRAHELRQAHALAVAL